MAGLLLDSYRWTEDGPTLKFEGPRQQVPLQQMLQALQPGGASGPATCITAASPLGRFASGPLDPRLCHSAPQLSAVTCLYLRTKCDDAGAPDLNDLLAALLPHTPHLARLAVWRSALTEAYSLGSSLVSLQGLTSLQMAWPLTHVPTGPYLEGGKQRTAALLCLGCAHNHWSAWACVQSLRSNPSHPTVPPQPLADLEHLSLRWLLVPRLPAALTTATRLSSLELSFQHQHCLQSSDVTGVLCQLPAMKRLALTHCIAPEAVAAERAALPNVAVEQRESRDSSLPMLDLF